MRKLGLVFPGQGTQYVGMGRELYNAYSVAREAFETAGDLLDCDLAGLCFGGPQEELDRTVNTQVSVLTVNFAIYRVYEQEIGIRPVIAAGHSLGEYNALLAAGALGFGEALRLVHARGVFQQEAAPAGSGAMAAIIGLGRAAVEEICARVREMDGTVETSIVNTDEQIVVSGSARAVATAVAAAKDRGARAKELPISVPCHCSMMNPAADRFRSFLDGFEFGDFRFPVIPNADPDLLYSKENARGLLYRQIRTAVYWRETILKMIAQGADTFVELGPRRTLSGLIRRINPGVRTHSVEDAGSLEKTAAFLKGHGKEWRSAAE
ncbi:MAG: ACP S-malonyltransferase [Syntrophales bacterium]|nr:ACP S-malonyltransferase [Syntrophales bacterium]